MTNAVISLIILAITVLLFISKLFPLGAAATIGCILFTIMGVCSFEEAFSGFSSSIVFLTLGMLIISYAMQETGICSLIARKVIKLTQNNENKFILAFMILSIAMSSFVTNTAVIASFLPLITAMSNQVETIDQKRSTLPIVIAALFGGTLTLVGSTPQLVANGILKSIVGEEIKMFDLLLPGLVLCLVLIVYTLTIGNQIAHKKWSDINSSPSSNIQQCEQSTRKQVLMLCLFIGMIVAFLISHIDPAIVVVTVALICMASGCISFRDALKMTNWNVIFLLAGCISIGTVIEKSGGIDLLSNVISKTINTDLSPLTIFAIIIITTLLCSNFINNTVTVSMVLPIALSICQQFELNPKTIAIGIIFAANLAFCTPMANGHIAMSMTAGYDFKDLFDYTWILEIVVAIVIIFVFPFFLPLS